MATKAITTVTILLSSLQAIGSAHDSEWTSISHESRLTKTTFQTDSNLVGPSNLEEGGQENGIRQDSKRIIERPENCKCENTATYRVGHIPPQIQPQIRQLPSSDLQCNYLKNQTPFTHKSWRQVRIIRMFEVSDDSCKGTFIENGFYVMKLLQQLDLSHNNLNMMERNTNVGKLFNNLANLHTVDLSYNNLSTLPPDIFLGAVRLHNLDLSNNRWNSLPFNMTQLINMKFLQTSSNYITYHESDISVIQHIVQYQQGRRRFNKTVKTVDINMRHNSLFCTCKALHVMRRFVQAHVSNRTPSYTCNIDNEQIPLDASAIPQEVYICDRSKRLRRNWIIGSTTTVVAVVLLTLAARFARLKWRSRKRQGVIDDVIRRFRNGNLAQNFILLLSHSSKDDDLVDDHVYPELMDRLQGITNIQRNLICTGNRNFRPGQRLFEEMDRCLSNSSVFVPVVTLNYVRSYWCKEELEQARMKQIPMIIFFAEHVPPDEMPNILRDFFMRNVRVKIRMNNGELTIQPSWKAVCDAIFYSVAETENNNGIYGI